MMKPWWCLGVLLLLSGILPAQDAPLTLAQCLELAREQQTDVQIGQRDVTAAEARATQAKSSYYPQIRVENSTRLARSGAVAVRDGSLTGLSASQNFYDGGVREANLGKAGAGVAQSTAALARTRQTVVFAVTRDYYSLLRAQKLAEVQAVRVKLLTEQLASIRTRVEAGDAAPVDCLPVEAQLANAQVDKLAADNAVRTAAITLQTTMGVDPRAGFAVLDVPISEPVDPAPLETLQQAALGARPDLRSAQAGAKAAKYGVNAAKIALAPRLVVTGDYAQPLLSGDPHSMTVSGGLAYDLFDGGANRAAFREAQATRESADLRVTQQTRDIRAEVQTAYLNLLSARDRLTASALSVQAAQKNLDAQQERYRLGLAIPLDLLNAQVELVTAQSNAAQSCYDYLTAQAQLDYAVGQ